MAARTRAAFPTAPDLPPSFEPAPPGLASEDVWDGVEAGVDNVVDEVVNDAQLRETVWTRGDLVGRTLAGIRVQDVRFVQCDLSGATWEGAQFDRVEFVGCRMNGAVFAGSAWRDVRLTDCRADGLDLRMADVRRSVVEGGTCREADLYAARLADVRLATDLTRATFDRVEATGLALHGSILDEVRAPAALRGAAIDAHQVLPLGAALVATLDFRIS